MTDEELMLLQILTYEKRCYEQSSVGEYVDSYTKEQLKDLEENGGQDGKDRAAAIRALQQNDNLKQLTIKETDVKQGIIVLTDPDEPNRGIALFQGTVNGGEWKDDAVGLYVTDTPVQQETLEYIKNLPYEKLTVTGHSKGGNKAMYVTVLDDRIDRCVAMDGQGFSIEFMLEYAAEIEKKTNRSNEPLNMR